MTAEADDRSADGETETVEVSAAQFFELGKHAHRIGHHDVARQVYEKLLQVDQDNKEVEHFLGLCLYQTGDRQAGLVMLERTLASPGATGGWWSNYGNLLHSEGRLDDAIDAFQQAIHRDPSSYDAYNNLGLVQIEKRNSAIAIACFEKALEIKPDFAIAWSNLGHGFIRSGRTADGVHALIKSISLSTTVSSRQRRLLGRAYGSLGDFKRAKEVYEDWLAEDPDNPEAAHHLAAVTGQTPARADERYVTTMFDAFADSFDAKLDRLEYRAPELVIAAAASVFGPARGDRRIADAGCGTGLCGPGLKAFASRLVGVDLSANMIGKARMRGVYDELAVAELTSHFASSTDTFDLIASADTLCYFGDLVPPLTAFRDRLAPGGTVVFTVEAHAADDGKDYVLLHHGRYAHRREHVQALLESIGFEVTELRSEQLRIEREEPVMGYLAVAARQR